MFGNRKQSIPKAFIEKMEIDKVVDALKAAKVVGMNVATAALRRQAEIRKDCARILQRSKDTNTGMTS